MDLLERAAEDLKDAVVRLVRLRGTLEHDKTLVQPPGYSVTAAPTNSANAVFSSECAAVRLDSGSPICQLILTRYKKIHDSATAESLVVRHNVH